jgi:hypothetical protein
MPLYYFHVRTDAGLVADEDGIELPDILSVLNEALVSAHDFLTDVKWSDPLSFEVADEHGHIVLRLPIQNLAWAWRQLTASQDRSLAALH